MRTSLSPRMDINTVGDYYVHEDGSLWRLVNYAAHPTATLEQVSRQPNQTWDANERHRVRGVVGAPIFSPFTRLVKETGE